MKNKSRSYSQQTRNRLIFWFIGILFTVGLGLIWAVYGLNAALLGFICLLGTSIPIGLIALFLFGLGKVADRQN
jgi:polyferredoxin